MLVWSCIYRSYSWRFFASLAKVFTWLNFSRRRQCFYEHTCWSSRWPSSANCCTPSSSPGAEAPRLWRNSKNITQICKCFDQERWQELVLSLFIRTSNAESIHWFLRFTGFHWFWASWFGRATQAGLRSWLRSHPSPRKRNYSSNLFRQTPRDLLQSAAITLAMLASCRFDNRHGHSKHKIY